MDDVRVYNRALTEQEIAKVVQGDPLLASAPQPATNATVDIRDAADLSWSAGTDRGQARCVSRRRPAGREERRTRARPSTGAGRRARASIWPDKVAFGAHYFWRIDEVEADGTIVQGDVWSFTVVDHLIVDEFESYTNDSPNRLFQTWLDGYGYSADEFFTKDYPGNGTGAGVGHDIWTAGTTYTTIAERTFVHGGKQSMPLYFDNASADKKYYSETERDLDDAAGPDGRRRDRPEPVVQGPAGAVRGAGRRLDHHELHERRHLRHQRRLLPVCLQAAERRRLDDRQSQQPDEYRELAEGRRHDPRDAGAELRPAPT